MRSATILGLSGTTLGRDEAAFFREADPWGFILFGRNIDTPSQVSRLTQDLREAVGRDAVVMIDQEGGRVQRLRAPHWREWLPPLDQARQSGELERGFWVRARMMAAELRAIGIDSNCAPCCDIAGASTHPFLQNRCFGTTAQGVIAGARATADGFLAGGVLPVMKHIPGHGRATLDSHKELPVVDQPVELLQKTDFAPFSALRDLPMAMTAHIRFTAVDPRPATQSAQMITLIRDQIGFDGVLMSDDISMQALSGTIAERAEATKAAGCDLVLHCNGLRTEMEATVLAAGELTPEAMVRTRTALEMRQTPLPADMDALARELADILGQPAPMASAPSTGA